MIISKFPNLNVKWTPPRSNLAFPDIPKCLNRRTQKHQLSHKILPNDIHFFDEHGTQVHNKRKHEENDETSKNDFYPFLYEKGEERKIHHLQNDGNFFRVNNTYEDPNLPKIESAQSCFDAGIETGKHEELRIRSGNRESTFDISQNTYSSVTSDADDEAPTNDERQEVNESNYEPNTSSPALKQCISENDKATENHELPKTKMGKQKTSTRELIRPTR